MKSRYKNVTTFIIRLIAGVRDRMQKFHALTQTKDLVKVQKDLAAALTRLAQAITIIEGAGLEEFREGMSMQS